MIRSTTFESSESRDIGLVSDGEATLLPFARGITAATSTTWRNSRDPQRRSQYASRCAVCPEMKAEEWSKIECCTPLRQGNSGTRADVEWKCTRTNSNIVRAELIGRE
ncbi:hypothetical protein TKK_0018213 [Trichogramma kaykai]